MAEPTVQVPVSLIEQVAIFLDGVVADSELASMLRATLSQPAPSAEPDVWEQAARIAERDAVGVTLSDLTQFPTVQATGARIAFNIRAAAQKDGPATAETLQSQGPHPKVTVLGRNDVSVSAAEPPRIEDMAAGTTFTQEVRWTVRHNAIREPYVENDTDALPWHYIDPSTIRDVTLPKEA